MTADSHIMTTAILPLFIDPHVVPARSHRTRNGMPYGSNRYVHLSRSRHRTGACHQKNQKCKLYNFTFHMLVFKYDDWTVHRSGG